MAAIAMPPAAVGISFALFAADKYVSSKYSVYYHKPNCNKVLRINPLISTDKGYLQFAKGSPGSRETAMPDMQTTR
jgi:hypothetical protein